MTKSSIVKRTVMVDGHRTSVSLEGAFWTGVKEIAAERGMTLSDLVSEIDSAREQDNNLSSAIRLFVLDHFKTRI